MDFRKEFVSAESKAMLALMKKKPDCTEGILKNVDMRQFYILCAEHEVEALVAANMKALGVTGLSAEWDRAYQAQKEKMSELKELAEKIARLLAKEKIDMILLKNGGIMMDIEEDCAKCAMGDLDTLVRQKDLKCAHGLLIENGFRFKFRSEFEFEDLEEAFKDGSTEYYIEGMNQEQIWVEVAWRAIAGRWIRRDLEPDTEELMAASHYAPDSHVRILSPEDNLLQVSIHTAKHSYTRAPGLRLHLDVERIVSSQDIDWDIFLKKVKMTRVRTAVYFSLLIPKQLFCTPIPEAVLKELKPGKLKCYLIYRYLRKAGLMHPKERKFGAVSFVIFQCLLYDGLKDLWKVFCPGSQWMKERYNYKNSMLLPVFLIKRGLDLIGIRKGKQN